MSDNTEKEVLRKTIKISQSTRIIQIIFGLFLSIFGISFLIFLILRDEFILLWPIIFFLPIFLFKAFRIFLTTTSKIEMYDSYYIEYWLFFKKKRFYTDIKQVLFARFVVAMRLKNKIFGIGFQSLREGKPETDQFLNFLRTKIPPECIDIKKL